MAEPWDDDLSRRYIQAMEQASTIGLQFGRIFDPDLPDDDRRKMFDWYRHIHATIRVPLAHAIPTSESIHIISLFSPIIEIGAGSGYWANLIRRRTGAQEAIENNPSATLFLCWPDTNDMASLALKAYQGDFLLYIGESVGRTLHGDFSQTGNVSFHLHLSRHFHEVLRLDLPRWPGNRDCFSVYKRTSCLTLAIGESNSIEMFQHVPEHESLRLLASSDFGDELLARARNSSKPHQLQ